MPRINRCAELLDQGQPIYYDRVNVPDLSYEHGLAMSGTWADFLRIEFEHIAFDTGALYDFMRGLRDAGPAPSGHSMPAVMCTLPATGLSADEVRYNSWQIRHLLSAGVHGLYLAHAREPEAVRAFVEACRFPHQTVGLGDGLGEGTRGHGGEVQAADIWGLDPIDYMRRADPWPLNREGELLLGVKVEDRFGLERADDTLAVPGVTFGEWGPGDMGMSYGHPEWRDAPYGPEMDRAWRRVKDACDRAGIRFLCAWDDSSMTPDERADHLINQVGATLIASDDGEPLAIAGRRLTGRTMPV